MGAEGTYDDWMGRDVYGADGEKVGTVDDIFYDDQTRRPEWVAIKTSLLGGRRLAPLAGATLGGVESDAIYLQFDSDRVKEAPKLDADEHLDADQERDLYSHYGFDWSAGDTSHFGYGDRRRERFDDSYDSRWQDEWSVATGDAPAQSQTQSQGEVVAEETVRDEQAQIVEKQRPVRLRKYRWTEQVPVEHEEVRMEEGPSS